MRGFSFSSVRAAPPKAADCARRKFEILSFTPESLSLLRSAISVALRDGRKRFRRTFPVIKIVSAKAGGHYKNWRRRPLLSRGPKVWGRGGMSTFSSISFEAGNPCGQRRSEVRRAESQPEIATIAARRIQIFQVDSVDADLYGEFRVGAQARAVSRMLCRL